MIDANASILPGYAEAKGGVRGASGAGRGIEPLPLDGAFFGRHISRTWTKKHVVRGWDSDSVRASRVLAEFWASSAGIWVVAAGMTAIGDAQSHPRCAMR